MKIAIKGDPIRGEEVIQILESLGGRNTFNYNGDYIRTAYFIGMDYSIYGFCTDSPKVGFKVYTLEEFETQFPFKIGDLCIYSNDIIGEDIVVKILGMTIENDYIMYEVGHKDITEKHSYIYRKRETLKPYKEMNTRNVTLTLEKAKEWYKKGGKLKEIALQAFTEKELNPLPRSWEGFCEKYPVKETEAVICCDSSIADCKGLGEKRDSEYYRDICPSKKSAEAHLAMIQLEQLRDCWRQGWVPDYTKTYKKFRIKKLGTEYIVDWSTGLSDFLVFQTEELAKEFLKCFRDLIEKAGDLI